MSVIALLEMKFAPESLDEARSIMHRVLDETRAFPGCLSVETLVDRADPTRLIFVEKWESLEADAAYRAFRAGEGKVTDIAPHLVAAPVLTVGPLDPAV